MNKSVALLFLPKNWLGEKNSVEEENMDTKMQRKLAIGLSLLNSIGVIATIGTAIKGTKLATKKLNNSEKELNKKEVFKLVWKDYIPTAVVATATIASGLSSALLSRKVEASLISAATMIDYNYKKYKDKVKEMLGVDGERQVTSSIANDKFDAQKEEIIEKLKNSNRKLFYEEHIGFFIADETDIAWAINQLNEDVSFASYSSNGFTTLKKFIEYSRAELLDKEVEEGWFNFGWSCDYLSEDWENVWIHVYLRDDIEEHGNPYTEVCWCETPVYNPECWYEWSTEHTISLEEYRKGAPKQYEIESKPVD